MSDANAPRRLGVIDVGSNSIKATLVEISATGYIQLKEVRYPVRLGRGVFDDGLIREDDKCAAIEALASLRRHAETLGIHEFHAVATSALREAHHGSDFLSQVYEATGICIRVISGEEEANLVAASTRAIPGNGTDRLLVDIGGGSTEIIHMSFEGELRSVASLPLGAVRLAGWLGNPPVYQADHFVRLHTHIQEALRQQVIPVITSPVECFGTGGTISSLIDMTLRLNKQDSVRAPRELTRHDVEHAMTVLQDKSAHEITTLLGVQAERSAILPAGTAVLAALVGHYDLSPIRMRRCGLRDGLIQMAMAEKLNKS